MTTSYIFWKNGVKIESLFDELNHLMTGCYGYSLKKQFVASFELPGPPWEECRQFLELREVLADTKRPNLSRVSWGYKHNIDKGSGDINFFVYGEPRIHETIHRLLVVSSITLRARCSPQSMKSLSRYYHLLRELMFELKADRVAGWDCHSFVPDPAAVESADVEADFVFQPTGRQIVSQRLEDAVERADGICYWDYPGCLGCEIFIEAGDVEFYRNGGLRSSGSLSPWSLEPPTGKPRSAKLEPGT